jgi:hypothetical protein
MICLLRKALVKLFFVTSVVSLALAQHTTTHGLGISLTALTVYPLFSLPPIYPLFSFKFPFRCFIHIDIKE